MATFIIGIKSDSNRDPKNKSKKICCCGGHSAHDKKKNTHHNSTKTRLLIRKSRQINKEALW